MVYICMVHGKMESIAQFIVLIGYSPIPISCELDSSCNRLCS